MGLTAKDINGAPTPKSIATGVLAVKSIWIMQAKNISNNYWLFEGEKLQGIVHLHI